MDSLLRYRQLLLVLILSNLPRMLKETIKALSVEMNVAHVVRRMKTAAVVHVIIMTMEVKN